MRKTHKHYTLEDKYDDYTADRLKSLDRQIHYKLYMLWTQAYNTPLKDIAKAVGKSVTTVHNYMNPDNLKKPNTLTVYRLSLFFKVPMYYLMEDSIPYCQNPTQCARPTQFTDMHYVEIISAYLEPWKVETMGSSSKKEHTQEYDRIIENLKSDCLSYEFVTALTPAARSQLLDDIAAVCNEIKSHPENDERFLEYKANTQE